MTATNRNFPIWLAILPIAATVLGLVGAIFVFHFPLYLGIFAGWVTGVLVGKVARFSFQEMALGTYAGMKSTFIVVTIMLLIGGVIAVWMGSGTVPGLIVYGIQLVNPRYLLLTSFILTMCISMMLGTSVGTLSTIGAALVGIASVYGIPLGLIGGALLSGAMIGDRTSPMSATLHLVSSTTGVRADHLVRILIKSAWPLIMFCMVLYTWLGWSYGNHAISHGISDIKITTLQNSFALPWYVLAPPLAVLVMAFMRVSIRTNLSIGIGLGCILAFFIQNRSIVEIAEILWSGFLMKSGGHTILQGGGIWPMFNQVLVIVFAGALNGLLEKTGIMQMLIGTWLKRIHTRGGLISGTVLTSLSAGFVLCNQALMVLMPGRLFAEKYKEMEVSNETLAKTLSNSGVVSSALIPWNLHGLLCSAAMGIATVKYFPYAFFLWMFPMITLVGALLNWIRENRS